MELSITKEKVLEAASKCDTAKATLKVLFPEVFEYEDRNAWKKDADPYNTGLNDVSKKIFGDANAIQVVLLSTPEGRKDLYGRAFYIGGDYEPVLHKNCDGENGSVIEIRKK